MTLDEAIKHCEEKGCSNTECAAEHRQLAKWLKELKKTRNETLPKLTDGIGQTRLGFTHEQIQAIERYVRRYVDYALRIQSEPVEWNIDNAKCGDILVYPDGTLAVFNYRLGGLDAGLYMSFLVCSSTGINYKQTCAINNATKATKEQIEVLFNKLKNDISIGWSEEDEKVLSNIIKDLVHPWNEYIPDRIEDEIKWLKNKLKSLRPQSHWKPTEEHIKVLSIFADNMVEPYYKGVILDLLEQLKVL